VSPEPQMIPFNAPPIFPGVEDEIVRAVLGGHTAGCGPFGRRCEERLRQMTGVPSLLTTSCTAALEMAALLLEISAGDEVVVPSFTFVSTANAFVLRGASLRFADCDENGQLSLDSVERALSPRTKAVLVMHYGGNCGDMNALLSLCEARGVAVVEDAAQCVGSTYKGRPLGTLGALGALSFHETKNVGAGEGGALLVNDPRYLSRAHHLRDKGTDRREFSLGMREKYEWVDVGSSWALSDLNAAYLEAQLRRLEEIHARRRAIWTRYDEELTPLVRSAGARTLQVPAHNTPNHHLFALVFGDGEARGRFIAHMSARRVTTPFHYVALHTSPFGRRYLRADDDLRGAAALSSGLVRLPLFYNLSDEDQGRVIESVKEFVAAELSRAA
jgi:dTDP-4-amino-4,6-dideoxygalactose transaminase